MFLKFVDETLIVKAKLWYFRNDLIVPYAVHKDLHIFVRLNSFVFLNQSIFLYGLHWFVGNPYSLSWEWNEALTITDEDHEFSFIFTSNYC